MSLPGFGKRSFGFGKRAFGFGKRTFGFKKRKGNDKSDQKKKDLTTSSPLASEVPTDPVIKRNDPDDASEYPGDNTRKTRINRRQKAMKSDSRESGMGDFGGGFSNYMKMLESDPIGENQDLQGDVFGGGMSGKYWDMYKGGLGEDSQDTADEGLRSSRQSPEEDQPEDAANNERSPKDQIVRFYNELKEAIDNKDDEEIKNLLGTLKSRKLNKSESLKLKDMRKLMIIEEDDLLNTTINDHSLTDDATEMQDKFTEFIDKMNKNIPDPIKIKRGIPSNLKSLSIAGLSSLKVVGKVKKSYGNHWKGTVSLPNLITSIASSPGPGVPFNGKVIGLFKSNRIHMTFRMSDEGTLHITSVKTSSQRTKFVPKFDSSVPLNPWSKVSMSGYMVSRIKKYIPKIVDKTILRLTHIVENLEK